MHYVVGLLVVVLFAGLAALFTAHALAIRRDYKDRFDRIGARLRRDAEDIVRNLTGGR
jgi:Flp pilus assembly protein TadB